MVGDSNLDAIRISERRINDEEALRVEECENTYDKDSGCNGDSHFRFSKRILL